MASIAIDPDDFRRGDRRALKTSERVARELVTFIVDKNLPEGTRLPNERDMVAAMGIGRTTLREALRLLETRGILNIRPGRLGGPVVRRPRPEDLGEALAVMLQLAETPLVDVFRTRNAIEPDLARLAASAISDEQLQALRGTIDVMLSPDADESTFLEENRQFHAIIADASCSTSLRIFSASVNSIADGALAGISYSQRRRHAVAAAHLRIIEALTNRDADAAEHAMREHLVEAAEHWKKTEPEKYSSPVQWL